jgi:hypothetical protein
MSYQHLSLGCLRLFLHAGILMRKRRVMALMGDARPEPAHIAQSQVPHLSQTPRLPNTA